MPETYDAYGSYGEERIYFRWPVKELRRMSLRHLADLKRAGYSRANTEIRWPGEGHIPAPAIFEELDEDGPYEQPDDLPAEMEQEPESQLLLVARELHSSPIHPIAKIKIIVANHLGMSVADFDEGRHFRKFVHLRFMAIYFARIMTGCSNPDIGARIRAGGLHQSTVQHGFEKIQSSIASDLAFAAEIEDLKSIIAEALK